MVNCDAANVYAQAVPFGGVAVVKEPGKRSPRPKDLFVDRVGAYGSAKCDFCEIRENALAKSRSRKTLAQQPNEIFSETESRTRTCRGQLRLFVSKRRRLVVFVESRTLPFCFVVSENSPLVDSFPRGVFGTQSVFRILATAYWRRWT